MMASTWNFLLTVVQISLLLDFLLARSSSFNQTSENSSVRLRNASSQWSPYRDNSVLRNHSSYLIGFNNNSLLKDSSSQTRGIPSSEDNRPYTIPSTELQRIPKPWKNYETSPSARKCAEYHKIVEKLEPIDKTKCSPVPPFIGGGTVAKPESALHIVALGRQNDDKEFSLHCGGTLVDPSWVLTAAHCTHGAHGGVNVARLGIQRLSDNSGQTVPIKQTIRHPSYRPPAMYADIALLELERPVPLSNKIIPGCLYQPGHYIPPKPWVFGWGATEFDGIVSDILQEAQLDFVDNVKCAIAHNRSISVPYGIMPNMICAGAPRNNWEQDTCQGDSGGPLQTVHPLWRCLFQIIGITSFGTGCSFVDLPGVYTRVSEYLDWIECIVWPELL